MWNAHAAQDDCVAGAESVDVIAGADAQRAVRSLRAQP